MRRIHLDQIDPTDSIEYVVDGESYTGEVIETGPDDELLELITVVDGLPHGASKSWYPDGTLKSEALASRGRATGIARKWHPNGVIAREVTFDSGGMPIETRTWNDEGKLLESKDVR